VREPTRTARLRATADCLATIATPPVSSRAEVQPSFPPPCHKEHAMRSEPIEITTPDGIADAYERRFDELLAPLSRTIAA
jgi:hypothetical protein